jgi:predicted lipoprotein with Yx(FWY)xxD motif
MNRLIVAALLLAAAPAFATTPAPTVPPDEETTETVPPPVELTVVEPVPEPTPEPEPEKVRGSTPVYGPLRPRTAATLPAGTAAAAAPAPTPAAAAAPTAAPAPAATAAPAPTPTPIPAAAPGAAPAPAAAPPPIRARSPVDAAFASPVPIWVRDGLLVEQGGRALYFFGLDVTGQPSRCDSACSRLWPPYLAPAGARPYGRFTITQSHEGKPMWAFNGRPLYRWISDRKRGDAGGDGINGTWELVRVTVVESREITAYFPMPMTRPWQPPTEAAQ